MQKCSTASSGHSQVVTGDIAERPIRSRPHGEEEKIVYRMLAELEGSGFVLTQRHSLGTEFVRCSFPAIPQDMAKGVTQVVRGETELKTVKSAKPARQGRKARARAARALHEEPQSRHTREACTSYALACEADRQDIRSPFGFGLSLYRSGNQDDEVALFLKTGEVRKASSAA